MWDERNGRIFCAGNLFNSNTSSSSFFSFFFSFYKELDDVKPLICGAFGPSSFARAIRCDTTCPFFNGQCYICQASTYQWPLSGLFDMEIANRTLRLPPQSADLPTRVFPPLNDIDSGIASSKISHQEVVGKLVIYSPDLLDVAPLRPSSSTASSFHPFFSISLYLSPSLSLSLSLLHEKNQCWNSYRNSEAK